LSRFVRIASGFRAVFFDQYGVLHDGRRPYPGAREALAALKARGVKIVVLSNSGRAGKANQRRMAALGLGPELYDFLLTSGDVARRLMKSAPMAARLGLEARAFVVSSDGRGFLVQEEEALAQTRAGKQVLMPGDGSRAALAIRQTSDHVALVGRPIFEIHCRRERRRIGFGRHVIVRPDDHPLELLTLARLLALAERGRIDRFQAPIADGVGCAFKRSERGIVEVEAVAGDVHDARAHPIKLAESQLGERSLGDAEGGDEAIAALGYVVDLARDLALQLRIRLGFRLDREPRSRRA